MMSDEIRKERRPLSRTDWIFIVLSVVLAGGLATFWFWNRSKTPPAAVPTAGTAAPEQVAAPVAPPTAVETSPAVAEPAVGTDDRMRSLLEPLSSNALFRSWLAQSDLVRRWVVVTDNLAEGVTPRKQLGFLAPSGPFSVVNVAGKTAIARESYQRYNGFADAIASMNASALAKAYRELHSILEAAYRALGYPGAAFDRVTVRALHRIEAAPVREGDVFVERQEKSYTYVDTHLENLGGVEKHLLRMGPRNTRLLQAKAKEIREALKLPATHSK